MADADHTAPPVEVLSSLSEMAITSEILAGSADLNEILQRLAQRAKEVTGADYAAISTFDDEGILTRFIYTGIDDEAARRLGDPPKGRGLLGELANQERPLRLAGAARRPVGLGDLPAALGRGVHRAAARRPRPARHHRSAKGLHPRGPGRDGTNRHSRCGCLLQPA